MLLHGVNANFLDRDSYSADDVTASPEAPSADQPLYRRRLKTVDTDETNEAKTLDLELRRLARREALGRAALGNVAEAFLRREAHCALGFARISDYASERLGMSASQLHEYARVARALRRLPLIARAFEAGEVGWTKVRELVGAATFETQTGWLRVAKAYTADGLRIAVRRVKDESGRTGIAPDNAGLFACAHAGLREENAGSAARADEEIDDEPAAVFRIRCPRRVRRLWHHVRVLARKVAGSDLADWQAAEAIAAEFFSLCGWPAGATNDESCTREARVGSGCARTPKDDALLEPRPPRSPLTPEELAQTRWPRGSIATDKRYLPESPAPEGFGRYSASAHDLDARMRAILAAIARTDWEMGRRLRTCFQRRLYLQLGCANEGTYVRNRLGICIRKARALVALERASSTVSPRLIEAYRDGQLSWVRCLMLLRIVNTQNAEAWIRRAGEVTVRRLSDEIEWALDVRDATGELDLMMPPPLGAPLVLPGSPSYGAARGAQPSMVERQIGGHERVHRDEGSAHEQVGRGEDALHSQRQIGGHDRADEAPIDGLDGPHADSEVYFRGPQSVVALFHAAVTSVTAGGEPSWRGLERVLLYAMAYWESLPRHRDPIFERDGWRCAATVCSARRNLQNHHIVFRSLGGGGARWNRITLCAWHHLRGIHGGRARLRGRAGEALYWQIGTQLNGPPLMMTVGDTYAEALRGTSARANRQSATAETEPEKDLAVMPVCECACGHDATAAPLSETDRRKAA